MRSAGGRRSAASDLMRFEIQKKGKLAPAQRYKRIMKQKLEESKKQALGSAYKEPFSFSNKIGGLRKMSARAEQALKEIAMKKAAKLAKAERKMVIVQQRNFHNGHITKKGEIYDIAGNLVARVNPKNGAIANMMGWGIGRYKPKSMFTNMLITDAIDKFSPYYIKLRQAQALQQQGVQQFGVHGPAGGQDVINVYGPADPRMAMNNPYGHVPDDPNAANYYGTDVAGPRQNIGITAWGARSDNVHGTFADNAWGTSADNVWGTNSSDVWGGVSAGNLWGNKGIKVWGTGNGKNYLRNLASFIAGFFGLSNKKNRETLRALNAMARTGKTSSSRTGSTPSTARSAPSAPSRTR